MRVTLQCGQCGRQRLVERLAGVLDSRLEQVDKHDRKTAGLKSASDSHKRATKGTHVAESGSARASDSQNTRNACSRVVSLASRRSLFFARFARPCSGFSPKDCTTATSSSADCVVL